MGKHFGTVYTYFENTDLKNDTYSYDKVVYLLKGFRARQLWIRPRILEDDVYVFECAIFD